MLSPKIKKYKKRLICYLKSRFAVVNENPIIVLGNQKSGTSAIAHLLADFGGLSKTIDIPPLWVPVVFDVMHGQIDFQDMVRRHRFYFSTDIIKEPNMTFFAGQVLKAFPKARYVFIVRDPRDNIRSLLNRMKIPGNIDEINEQAFSSVSLNRFRMTLDASLWGGDKTENYIGALSHKWNKAVDNYLLYRDRMILAKYEDFLIDKYGFIAKLAKQLHIPEKANIRDRLDVQYQPRGDRSISWEDFFCIENLTRIEHICSSRMKEFGYKI
ncbi:MAG: sulfotransferase [Planctomycetes bacterium]|nr:sulfotransferase [Planctomycetota bacterium]